MRRVAVLIALVALGLGLMAAPGYLTTRTSVLKDFTHFESAHVHPAVMTPDGTRLLVVNTPDNRLSVFDLTGGEPWRVAEVPVGLEPVSVAVQDDQTAWVVNNVSDDVSIVDLTTMHVKSTLHVGDEPNDVVFAGSPRRAYVSVSQEDRIRVYDPANLAAPPTNIPINGRYPRSLAANAAGTTVYAAVFFAGNRTSVLSFNEVPADSQPQDPAFPRDPQLTLEHGPGPRVGLMVQQQGNDWRDMYGKLWNHRVPYRQYDVDVAEIPAGASSPSRTFGGLAAVNFAIAVSPSDGRVAVAGTEARNLLRFEPRLRGHAVDTRVSFITAAGATRIADLNPHVDYDGPGTRAERDSALGIPTGLAYSGNGQRAYVTSLASDKLGVLDPVTGAIVARVGTVAGPTGVVADQARGRIYVVGRFRNQLQTLSAANLREVGRTGIGFDPTPDEIVNGRKFFYGGFTSAHGEQSCASCHLFGDFDNLAWDLGDPAGHFIPPVAGTDDTLLMGFDPMKGPMTTQSMRMLPGTGRLHWRADRANLAAFNPAFVGLMGRSSQLPDSEMTAFGQFVNDLAYPPNPAENLDRTMPDAPPGQPSAKRGRTFFFDRPVDADRTCSSCHKVPNGTSGEIVSALKLFETQDMKTPQLRNLYKKTGFTDAPMAVNKRGFGFTHDGSVDNIFNFLKRPNFEFDPGPSGDLDRRDVEAFLLAFDTGTAPAVGCQITFDASNRTQSALTARVDTLRAQAALGACDIIAQGRVGGQPRGWWYQNDGMWRPDKVSEPALSTPALLVLAGTGSELSIIGVPPGSGGRMGNDRDRDGYLDGDELDAGSDPGDGASTPTPGSNRRPLVEAGPDLSITLPSSATLSGNLSDDGLPMPPGALSIHWRKVSGPGTVTFANPLSASTTVSFSQAGSYELSLTASDGKLSTSDGATVVVRPPCTIETVERRVAAGGDDAEENASGSVSLGSSDLELVYDGSLQTVGLRFTGIDIPQGAVITSAYLQFMSKEIQSEATNLKIYGQDADSAAAYTTASRDVSSRPRTDAFATWTPAPWTTIGIAGLDQRTPDLAAVLQEIVDRPGWQGRSLALVVTGTGHRTARSFEGLNSSAALLHIEFGCGNRRPVVDAGRDQSFSFDPELRTGGGSLERSGGGVSIEHDIPSTSLSGRVTDDGLPNPPGRCTSTWRQVSGPGAVSFADSLSPATIVVFPGAGTYVLSLTGFDGERSTTDQVTVKVSAMYNVVNRAIADGSDDVEETAAGAMSLAGSGLQMMIDGSAQRAVGLRFTHLPIPPGVTVTSAWVQFKAKEAQTEATTLTLRGQAHDNAPAFTSTSGDVSSRALTSAGATWPSLPGWVAGQAAAAQRTPDLMNVIQEIVSRPGWMSGNAIALVVTGTGHRTAFAFEDSALNAAVLHVEYYTPNLHSMPTQAQTVNAGPDTTVMLNGAAFLHGHQIDVRLGTPTMLMWSRLSGPGGVTFDTPLSWVTRATFGTAGLYRLGLMTMHDMLHSVDTVSVTVVDATPTTAEARIATGTDDVEETAAGGVSLGSSDLEMMIDGTAQRAVGLRFVNLAIPRGVVVSSAWVQFKAKEAQSEATTLTVRGQAHDNAPAFVSASGNVTARMVTAAQATWTSLPAWVVGAATAAQRTPDLKDVIQEIVSRPGWASGNALALVVTGTGHRTANAFESGAANAALLHVEYMTAPPPPVANQAPTADAGPDTTVVWDGANGVALLHGRASDDGVPGPMMMHWNPVSGPGLVRFDNHMAAVTRATFGALGTYRLELMAMDGALETSDTLVVTVVPTGVNQAPMAALALPSEGIAPLLVTVDASASKDANGDSLTYSFDFGDGVVSSAQRTPVVSHQYAAGTWTVNVIVADGKGAADTATAVVTAHPNLVKNPSFETALTGWNANGTGATVARVAGGHQGAFCIEARGDSSLVSFGVNDAPNVVSLVAGAGARYRFSAWVRSERHTGKVQLKVREYLGGVLQGTQIASTPVDLGSAWQLITMDVVATVAGSTLDFQIIDKPLVTREVFQVDEIAVYLVPPATASPGDGATLGSTKLPAAPVSELPATPSTIRLAAVFPNPTPGGTTVRFELAREAQVEIEVYDLRGALVRRIASGRRNAGTYSEMWDGRDCEGQRLPRGMYLVRFDADHHRESRKIVITQ